MCAFYYMQVYHGSLLQFLAAKSFTLLTVLKLDKAVSELTR